MRTHADDMDYLAILQQLRHAGMLLWHWQPNGDSCVQVSFFNSHLLPQDDQQQLLQQQQQEEREKEGTTRTGSGEHAKMKGEKEFMLDIFLSLVVTRFKTESIVRQSCQLSKFNRSSCSAALPRAYLKHLSTKSSLVDFARSSSRSFINIVSGSMMRLTFSLFGQARKPPSIAHRTSLGRLQAQSFHQISMHLQKRPSEMAIAYDTMA